MAGRIPPATLEQIRAANDIVEVIGGYFPLKRAGANYVALCPFHKEKSPSFNVNPHRQIFHCFGCHKGGDVFSFVQEYENIPFPDAVQRLAERAGVAITFEDGAGRSTARHLKDQLLDLHEQITRRWHTCLLHEAAGQPGRDYLTRRGVASESIQQFRLGFAPDAWEDTVHWARSKSYDLALVEQAGLIIRKDQGAHFYDRFRGRLIFPIADEQGRMIGFSGRLLESDAKAAKYVNSPETPIFHKSRVFFGLDKARRPMLEEDYAVVCEGQLDLIACHVAGVRNVVAPQGTAFTADHARILKRHVDEVVLCFDSDPAGQSAAVRALESLLAASLTIRVAVLPSPHDPDSFIRQSGPDAFRQLIERAPGYFEFLLDQLCRLHDPNSDRGRVAILVEMGQAVLKARNQVLLDAHSRRTAQRLGVAPESVRAEWAKLARHTPAPPSEDAPGAAVSGPAEIPPAPSEFWLLRVLMLHEDLVDWTQQHLDLNWIQHPRVRSLLACRFEHHLRRTWHGLSAFLHEFEEEADGRLITEAASEARPIADPELALKGNAGRAGILRVLRDEYADRRLEELQREAQRADLQPADIERIESERSALRRLRRQPLEPLRVGTSSEREAFEREGGGAVHAHTMSPPV